MMMIVMMTMMTAMINKDKEKATANRHRFSPFLRVEIYMRTFFISSRLKCPNIK